MGCKFIGTHIHTHLDKEKADTVTVVVYYSKV